MEVSVKNIVSQLTAGVIFNGENSEGRVYRVRVKQPLFPAVGETYAVSGSHSEFRDGYGRTFPQIEASTIERTATSGRLVAGYLMTLTGIGEARAKRLTGKFCDNIHEVLSDPDQLEVIGETLQPDRPGLGLKLAVYVQMEFIQKLATDQDLVAQFEFFRRLEQLGVQDRGAAGKLWRLLGSSKAGDTLLANPYLAAAILPWSTADALGRSILRSSGAEVISDHPDRLRGAVDAATRKLLAQGHTAAPEILWRKLAPKGVIGAKMVSEGRRCGALLMEGGLVRPLGARYLENDLAKLLGELTAHHPMHSKSMTSEALEEAEAEICFALTDEQRDAVIEILGRPLACLQGGAGVGKTTVMAAVTHAWEALGGNVLMAALAGKAALQLSRSTSRPGAPRLAVTIARLIHGVRAVGEGKTGEHLPKLARNSLLIIDEAAMVDTATLHELLSEIRKLQTTGFRLLLVGDSGQLPPVGFGAVFHELVKTAEVTSHLTRPLRQANGSSIPVMAARVRRGEVPEVQAHNQQTEGVHFVDVVGANLIAETARIYRHIRSKSAGGEEIMVCAAKNATVDDFNKAMIAENWEDAKQLGLYARVYPGDPIICTKNHYSSGLFNGMLGVVREIQDEILVSWDGEDLDPETGQPLLKSVPQEIAIDIKLAYAITCHKSQGTSAKVVIVMLDDTPLLTREWLYTAVTRAETQVILVGAREDLSMAVSRRTQRITGFKLVDRQGAG